MAESLYFYKLISPYKEDQTKNCRLTISEIDSNFITLKDYDIKSMNFDEETNVLTLTRNNGETLQVDLSSMISGVTRDLNVSFDDCLGELTISYNGITKVISGFITQKNLGDKIMTEAITDGTIVGNGRDDSPLGLNPIEQTGFYKPVISLIDTTTGGVLPECNNNGDRYLTLEEVDDYGNLYNYAGVSQIAQMLADANSPWRIPTKADWDSMLNAIEPCAYRNHNSAECHVELGKLAGKKLKTADKWLCDNTTSQLSNDVDYLYEDIVPQEKAINPIGTDDYGFSVLPGGYGVSKDKNLIYFGEHGTFWSSTQTFPGIRSDYYTKTFTYDSTGVWQTAECPDNYYSLRLVKDYDGSNAHETEYIAGKYYPTVLMPSLKDDSNPNNKHGHSIWTSVNIDLGKNEGVSEENYISYSDYGDLYNTSKHKAYIINHWTGKNWERKRLVEGDTIVINSPTRIESSTGEYIEYDADTEFRLVKIDGVLRLIATSDVIYLAVLKEIMPLFTELDSKLDRETSERIAADEALNTAITTEHDERVAADEALNTAITTEREERIIAIETLTDALDAETEQRIAADDALNEAITTEHDERVAADDALNQAITTEREERIAADEALNTAITTEHDERVAADEALNQAIATEREERIAADAVLQEEIDEIDDKVWSQIITGATVDISEENHGVESITLLANDEDNNIIINLNGNYGEF